MHTLLGVLTLCAHCTVCLAYGQQVIDSNSDTDVVEHFTTNVDECKARLREAGKCDAWTAGMDAELELLVRERERKRKRERKREREIEREKKRGIWL